jgi:hypothetical protein
VSLMHVTVTLSSDSFCGEGAAFLWIITGDIAGVSGKPFSRAERLNEAPHAYRRLSRNHTTEPGSAVTRRMTNYGEWDSVLTEGVAQHRSGDAAAERQAAGIAGLVDLAEGAVATVEFPMTRDEPAFRPLGMPRRLPCLASCAGSRISATAWATAYAECRPSAGSRPCLRAGIVATAFARVCRRGCVLVPTRNEDSKAPDTRGLHGCMLARWQ